MESESAPKDIKQKLEKKPAATEKSVDEKRSPSRILPPLKRRVAAMLAGLIAIMTPSDTVHQNHENTLSQPTVHGEVKEAQLTGVANPQDIKRLLEWAEQRGAYRGERYSFEQTPTVRVAPGSPSPSALSEISQVISAHNPRDFLDIAKYLKKKVPNLTELISEASERNPVDFLYNAKDLKEVIPQSEWSILVEKLFQQSPEEGMYGVDYTLAKNLLNEVKEPQLESTSILKRITHPHTALLLNDMVRHGLSEKDAYEIINDQNKLLKTLIKIKSEPDHLGRVSVDEKLKDISLKTIRHVNDLHEQADSVRFKSVNNLKAAELYTLMVYGEEEIYTSSFNGMLNRLMDKMKQEKLDGKKLLEQVGQNKFRTFIKEMAGFNRLNEFLGTMDKDSSHELLSNVVKNLDKTEEKLAQATTVADIFSMVTDAEMLKVLQEQIKQEYERVTTIPDAKKEDRVIYGILSGMFGDKAVVNEAWLKEMSEKFKLPNLTEVKSTDLFNRDNTNIQQYFFYNDEDGKASFDSFLNQYQNKHDWRIDKQDHFVRIASEKNGKKMEIFANYPNSEEEGPEDIEKKLKDKNIQTIVVVHRGHSFHAAQTIERIPSIAKIVSLGSCGGYNNVERVLQRAPNAHILSTKGTGTMHVNDPLMKSLNGEILSGQDIVWPEFWGDMENKLGGNKDFGNYVPPHENLGVMFLKAYRQELKKN